MQEETSPIYMKKMMSFYALTKNLGSSVGSSLMGYLYATTHGLFGANLQNILGSIVILMIILMISWSWTYKEQHD